MDHVCPKDTFWFCVKLNPSIRLDPPSLKGISNLCAENQLMRSSPPSGQLKDLLNLSAEKLVSDVCLLRHRICYLPAKIRSFLLFKAICDGRILSVVELTKYCPYEEFKIPIPSILKNYHVNKKQFAKDELRKHYDVVVSIFSTYLNDIVGQKCDSSRLKILDLGSAPVCCGWLINRLKDFIKIFQDKFMKDSRGSSNRKQNPKNIKSVKEIKEKTTRGSKKVSKTPDRSQEYSRGSSKRKLNLKNTKSVKEIEKKATRGSEKVPKTPNRSQEYSKGSSSRKSNPKNAKSVKEIGRKATRGFEKVPKTPNRSQENSRGSSKRKQNPKNTKSVKETGNRTTRSSKKVPLIPNLSQEYVLKCSIRVEHNNHLTEIKECFEKLKCTNLKVVFSGVFFLNVFCQQKEVLDLVENVNEDSKLLSIMFSDFNPRLPSLLNLMEKFKYLKYLNVSKLSLAQSQDLKPEFLASVSKLTTLKRLVLRDVQLTGHLSLLLCEFSQQKSDPVIARQCCLAHCGSLKYLDVSGCSLSYKDLKFLEQLSYSKSLKYLDIGDNLLPLQSTCQTLLLLSSSLSVLHMDHCFDEYLEYNSETFPLSTFTQLRVLSIGGMKPTPASLKMLYKELEKINLNILKFGSEIWVGCHLACLDILIQAWSQE